MNGGSSRVPIPPSVLWDDYYESLHSAYNAMRNTYASCSAGGLTQDDIAARLNVDKSLVSRRLNGTENLTLKSISYMASAMECRVVVNFVPYENVGMTNLYLATATSGATGSAWLNSTEVVGATGGTPSLPLQTYEKVSGFK
jgi:hypothetical protein